MIFFYWWWYSDNFSFFKNLFCILMELNNTMYESNKDASKKYLDNLYPESPYVMWHLGLCGMSLQQMKTIVSIDYQWIELWLLCQCASLCMEQYTWIHAISSKMHAEWFFLSFKLPEPHLGQDIMVRQDNTLFMEFQLLGTMDQVSQLDPGLYFHSAMLVTTSCLSGQDRCWYFLLAHLLVVLLQGYLLPLPPDCEYSQCMTKPFLFCAPWVSLISFSIPTLAASAGTIPSRAGFILSMSNTLISPHMIPLEWPC